MAEIFVTTVRFEAVAVRRLLAEWQQELVRSSPGFSGDAPAAHALFRSAGFAPIADYNGNPYAQHWFGKRLLDP